jgi:hypothetical protein
MCIAAEEKSQLIGRIRRQERNRLAVFHNPIGASTSKFCFTGRGSARNDSSASSFARANAGWSIFYDNAIFR